MDEDLAVIGLQTLWLLRALQVKIMIMQAAMLVMLGRGGYSLHDSIGSVCLLEQKYVARKSISDGITIRLIM